MSRHLTFLWAKEQRKQNNKSQENLISFYLWKISNNKIVASFSSQSFQLLFLFFGFWCQPALFALWSFFFLFVICLVDLLTQSIHQYSKRSYGPFGDWVKIILTYPSTYQTRNFILYQNWICDTIKCCCCYCIVLECFRYIWEKSGGYKPQTIWTKYQIGFFPIQSISTHRNLMFLVSILIMDRFLLLTIWKRILFKLCFHWILSHSIYERIKSNRFKLLRWVPNFFFLPLS